MDSFTRQHILPHRWMLHDVHCTSSKFIVLSPFHLETMTIDMNANTYLRFTKYECVLFSYSIYYLYLHTDNESEFRAKQFVSHLFHYDTAQGDSTHIYTNFYCAHTHKIIDWKREYVVRVSHSSRSSSSSSSLLSFPTYLLWQN